MKEHRQLLYAAGGSFGCALILVGTAISLDVTFQAIPAVIVGIVLALLSLIGLEREYARTVESRDE